MSLPVNQEWMKNTMKNRTNFVTHLILDLSNSLSIPVERTNESHRWWVSSRLENKSKLSSVNSNFFTKLKEDAQVKVHDRKSTHDSKQRVIIEIPRVFSASAVPVVDHCQRTWHPSPRFIFFFSNIPSHYWHCSIAINTIRIILSSRWNLLPWTPNDKSDLMISVVCPETKLTVLFIVAVLWLIIVSSPYKLWRSEWKSKSKLNYDFAHSPIITEVTRIQSKCLNDENWKLYRRRILEMARSENSIHERFNIPVIDIRLNDNRQTIAFDYWLTSRILIPISDLGTKFYHQWRKIPSDDILEGLYKLRIRESEKLKTVLELYTVEIHQNKAGLDYHRLRHWWKEVSSRIYELRILFPETEIMRQTPWSRIWGQNIVNKEV